jgi:hypothetical protein
VEGVRAKHPIWIVGRYERDEDGRTDGYVEVESFWSQEEADRERDRLHALNQNPSAEYVVQEHETTVVYPADEPPPWEPDPDRLRRRGWET